MDELEEIQLKQGEQNLKEHFKEHMFLHSKGCFFK